MTLRKVLNILILSVLCIPAFAETTGSYQSGLSLKITPGVDLPLGESTVYFNPGILTDISLQITPESLGPFYGTTNLGFVRNQRDSEQYLTKFALTAGMGVRLKPLAWLSLCAEISGGYSFCMMDTDDTSVSSGIPVITASAGPAFDPAPNFSINLAASYQGYLGLTHSLGAVAGITYRFKKQQPLQGSPRLEGLPPQIINLEFDEIFPVFYSYYDDTPAGSALLINPREDEITDITLEFYVNQYMDTPKRCSTPERLAPGESGNIDIIALFNNSVLGLTEGTKVAAELTLSYSVEGIKYTDVYSKTMRMQYRNAMTWDDDRRAAAFVTAKDPSIMGFAKNVASMLHQTESQTINEKLQKAMAIHNALTLYGMTYVIDPTTAYADLSNSATAVDFLQFPRETLEYRAGDCDDLSILHSALFEAVGIETAFVTVPGHIFIAFSLGITPREAVRTFYNRENLIIHNEKVWIPFEVTALEETFLEAWELGARQWNRYNTEGQAGFFPIREAWELYKPVGLPGEGAAIVMPGTADVVGAFKKELAAFIIREMGPQEEQYRSEIEQSQGSPRSHNKLGILYARYDLIEKAIDQFEAALKKEEYFPALLNMGNIRFMENRMEEALEYYSRAKEIKPESEKLLLALARTAYSMGNSIEAAEYFSSLEKRAPELAARFAYLDPGRNEGERAAAVTSTERTVLWEEEGEGE